MAGKPFSMPTPASSDMCHIYSSCAEYKEKHQCGFPRRQKIRIDAVYSVMIIYLTDLYQFLTVLCFYLVSRDLDDVNNPPYAGAAEGKQFYNAKAGIPKIKTVYAKLTQQNGKDQRGGFGLHKAHSLIVIYYLS
jgi:hypothetical protein